MLPKSSSVVVVAICLLPTLFFVSQKNFLLFHSLAEGFSIIIAGGMFMIAWNTRNLAQNSYLLFLGYSYLFVCSLDLLHTMAYKGMGVFPGNDANLPTQLWIAARYVESVSLLLAPVFLRYSTLPRYIFGGHSIVFLIILTTIFFQPVFPDCYLEGEGLTNFKKVSEYLISLILLGAVVHLYRKRALVEPNILRLIVVALVTTICSELLFTFYIGVYDLSNVIGHFLKIVSYYFIYVAIIQTGLSEPFSLLLRDIEQQREAIKQSEKKFRGLFENALEMILFLDGEGNIIDVNRTQSEKLGYSRQDLVGRNIKEFIHPDYRDGTLQVLAQAHMGKAIQSHETALVTHSNELVNVEFNAVPEIRDGQLVNIRSILRDITFHKQADLERTRLEGQLRQAEKMQAVGTMAGGIAHEFNNLLSVIMGCAEMAVEKVKGNTAARQNLDLIMKASHRASELVNKILSFSRKVEQTRVAIDICCLVEDSLQLIRASCPSSVKISEEIGPNCGSVLVDPTEFQQIMMNLSSNSVWAMKESGTIHIVVTGVELMSEQAAALGVSEGWYQKLAFSDSGQGIDDDEKSRIFDPFYTGKNVGEGTGMGLAIVYSIMKSYHGAITCESEVGKGTIFNLYFPRSDEQKAVRMEKSGEPVHGFERILFIDDNELYLQMSEKMLRSLGYDVDSQTDSRQALEVFRNDPDGYHLVITDQVMPGLSGEELVKELRLVRADIPVILCTGYSARMNKEKAEQLGINAFVYKPLTKKDISELIRMVLDSR